MSEEQTNRQVVEADGNESIPAGVSRSTADARDEVCSITAELQQIEILDPDRSFSVHSLTTQCGIGKYRPKCMQRFAGKSWMLFWMCWFCLVQGMLVNGLVPAVLSTIERRFDFTTSMLGRIMLCYDIGYVLCCIPVSYFGGRHSKPLYLGIGLFIMGCGSMLFSFPHIVSQAYTAFTGQTEDSHCFSKSVSIDSTFSPFNLTMCSSTDPKVSDRNWYLVVFCTAHFLHGVGATPLFTIGVSYMDENVKPSLSALYLGVFYAFAIFGPAIGFLMSGTFLRFHTDFMQSERHHDITAIDETDQSWIGAWWIGFQIASILGILAVFPLASFPKVLPEAVTWQKRRMVAAVNTKGDDILPSKTKAQSGPLLTEQVVDEVAGVEAETKEMSIWIRVTSDIRHIPEALKRLFTNSSFMLITIAASVEGLLITGMSTFMSKYLERQFDVSASRSNVLIGCIMVPMAGFGTMLSGFIVKYFRLTCTKTLKFSIAMVVLSLVLTPMFLIYCDHSRLIGVEKPYPIDIVSNDSLSDVGLRSTCNGHCGCSSFEFHPICAETNDNEFLPFFSPCYAGCSQSFKPERKFYTNCTCAPNAKQVKKGLCHSKCTGLVGFLILFAPMVFCTFSFGVPMLSVVLRTVDYNERSFALGIQWIMMRCIGTMPAPVLFGWLFDVSCIRRHTDQCTSTVGSCFLYYNKLLADLFLAFAVICQTVCLLFLVLALVFFRHTDADDPIQSVHDEQQSAVT